MNPLVPDGYDVLGIVLAIFVVFLIIGLTIWLTIKLKRRNELSSMKSKERNDSSVQS